MQLNREQDAAVQMARDLVRGTEQGTAGVAVLNGPAGTGKTTVLRAILDATGNSVGIATPTGRAALRVRQQTGRAASTIHSLFYSPEEDEETGKLTFIRHGWDVLAETLPAVLAIDEASMVGRELWEDVLRTCQRLRRSILLVGDGEQLPPVEMDKNAPSFSVFAPDFQAGARVSLVDVFRQALDSPILGTATKVRLAKSWQQVQDILNNGALPWLAASHPLHEVSAHMHRTGQEHVIIAHKNATRLGLNHWVRYACGRPTGTPLQPGEPLLVRRNNQELGCFNGEIVPYAPRDEPPLKLQRGKLSFDAASVNGVDCVLHQPSLLHGTDQDPEVLPLWAPAAVQDDHGMPFLRAHLGYVLTCHSAQGSEWDRVFVNVEGSLHAMPEDERRRWVYTAVSRAKSELWLVRG